MKFTCKHAILATAVAALLSQTSSAASYTAGDLLLGFQALGGQGVTTNYVVDLGSAATLYRDASSGFTISTIGSIGLDLAATYGANWSTRADLNWGLIANANSAGNVPPPGPAPVNGDTTRTIYASNEQPTPGTQSTNWTISTDGAMGQSAGNVQSLKLSYQAATGTVNSNGKGVFLDTGSPNSWTTFNVKNPDKSFTNFVDANGIEGSFANGAAGTALDLYRILDYTTFSGGTAGIVPSAAPARTGNYVGTFTIDSTGNLTFRQTVAESAAVPEPVSTGILSGLAFVGLAAFRRHQKRAV